MKPSKFVIGGEVEFGGALITSETVGTQCGEYSSEKSGSEAFKNLRRPHSKKEVQIFCGIMTSLQAWNPHIPLNAPIMRAVTGGTKNIPFEWTDAMEAEFVYLKESMIKV